LRGEKQRLAGGREENYAAQDLFQRAIELDPAFALAYTGLGWSAINDVVNGWAHDPPKQLKKAHDLAQVALGMETHSEGHALLGMTYLLMKHFDLAKESLNLAVKLNPNDASSIGALGGVNLWTSQLDQAEDAYAKSIRLDPRSTDSVLTGLGTVWFFRERYVEARSVLEKSLLRNPENLFTYLVLAVTYAELGLTKEASLAVRKIHKIHPFFEVTPYRAAFSDPALGQKLAQELVKLGLK
jgi:adenylate cyclase